MTDQDNARTLLERLRAGEHLPPSELDFRGASLRGEDLSGLELSGADFTDADLSDAVLDGARLFKAKLDNASLVGATLGGAELTGASLRKANLEGVRGFGCGLGLADLAGARLLGADFSNATLTKAILVGADLRTAVLERARLREADLRDTDCTGADLRHCDLALARVDGAILDNADLRGARLRHLTGFDKARWYGADIRDINFAGAYRLRRFVIDQNYLKEFRESSRPAEILYRIWWLTSDCGRSISRWCLWIVVAIGLFAWLYTLCEVDYGKYDNWIGPFYYSVVTITTLGYGDIVPASPAARIVAMVEVMVGYVMLGGLLSIFTNKMARRGD